MYGDAHVAGQPVRQPGRRGVGGGQDRTAARVYVGIIDEGYMYTHDGPRRQRRHEPRRDRRQRRRRRRQRLRRRRLRLGLRRQQQHGLRRRRPTTTARTSPAPSAASAATARASPACAGTSSCMSAKFLGKRGGTTANAIKAVDYFTDLKTRHGLNIVATNNSWGGGGFSQALQDAIERANTADILFVAAAGNSGRRSATTTTRAELPVELPERQRHRGGRRSPAPARSSSFSNYGATTVDLGAPGSGICSTVPVSSKGKSSPATRATAAPRWPRRT